MCQNKSSIITLLIALFASVVYGQSSFPGAQGFGAAATGGRGGQVIYVTNLNPSGPGSLTEALSTQGKRYILFKVSGVIDAVADITYGEVTIAGQTSPHGIVVRGILADEIYDTVGTADNIIIRHLRSRPNTTGLRPSGYILDDALRLDGASNVMIDHCSFANAVDEAVQISNSMNVSLQHSMLAETIGEHFYLGGMLLNYSSPEHPQDNITIHHCLWNRIGGRYPEISCESPYAAARPLHIEFSYNLFWDQQVPMLYNANIDPSADPPKDSFFLNMNLIGNRSVTDSTYSYSMFTHSFLEYAGNQMFVSDNRMQQYNTPLYSYSDLDLFYCCNDFIDSTNRPNRDSGKVVLRSARFDFPLVTNITFPPVGLRQYQVMQGGAFPRDSMDRRLFLSLLKGKIDNTFPIDSNDHYKDAFIIDYDTTSLLYPSDLDGDGMPDWWELHHGSDYNIQNHNDLDLAAKYNVIPAYTNLELYLNKLADSLVTRKSTLLDTASTSVYGSISSPVKVYSGGKSITVSTNDLQKYDLSIVDITGKVRYSTSFSSYFTRDLSSECSPGIYFVVLRSKEGMFSRKVQLQ
jgi:pectate lyase